MHPGVGDHQTSLPFGAVSNDNWCCVEGLKNSVKKAEFSFGCFVLVLIPAHPAAVKVSIGGGDIIIQKYHKENQGLLEMEWCTDKRVKKMLTSNADTH